MKEKPEGGWSTYTVVIFFESKKFTACKIKDEKEETIFYFFDGVQSTEDYPSIATHTIRYKFFSVITQLTVKVTLLYFC